MSDDKNCPTAQFFSRVAYQNCDAGGVAGQRPRVPGKRASHGVRLRISLSTVRDAANNTSAASTASTGMAYMA